MSIDPSSAVSHSQFNFVTTSTGDTLTRDGTFAPTPIDAEYTFRDLLDVINPLHHIPIVSHFYREATGDEIKGASRVLGGGLYGGPVGMVVGLINAMSEEHTGRDVSGHAIAMFRGEDAEEILLEDGEALADAGSQDESPSDRTAEQQAEAEARFLAQLADAVAAPTEAAAEMAAEPVQMAMAAAPTSVAAEPAERSSRMPGGFAVPPRVGVFGPLTGNPTRHTASAEAAALAERAATPAVPSVPFAAVPPSLARGADPAADLAEAPRADPLAAFPSRVPADIDDQVDATLRALVMATQNVDDTALTDMTTLPPPAGAEPLAGTTDGRVGGGDGLAGNPMLVGPEAVPDVMLRALETYQRANAANGG